MLKHEAGHPGTPETAQGTNRRQADAGGKMEQYVTGSVIRTLREKKGLTQRQLAERLLVSDKAVSKWETGVSHS